MDPAVKFLTLIVLAIVTGRRNYDDARIHQAARRATERIILVGIDRERSQTHVDNADLVFLDGSSRLRDSLDQRAPESSPGP